MSQMMNDPVTFGGNNLLNIPGLRLTGMDTFRFPSRDVKNYPLAYTSRSKTTSAFHYERSVNVRGVFSLHSRDDLDTSIGLLRMILDPINQTLRLPISGELRDFYEVTVKNIAIEDVAGGHARIDIEFGCADPHSHAITDTTLLSVSNLTSGNKSYPVTLDGTAKQLPVITYHIDSLTTGSNRTVTFLEPLSGMSLAVQRTWTANETLIIDCAEQSVTVDGEEVDFNGNFPEWSVGPEFINYTDDFTARQVDITVVYKKRYL